jgi:hypothetical protein
MPGDRVDLVASSPVCLGSLAGHEGVEEVAAGDDPHQAVILDDWERADAPPPHHSGRLHDRVMHADR